MTRSVRLRLALALGALATLLPACGIANIDLPDLSPTVIAEGSKSGIPPVQVDGAAFMVVVKTTLSGKLEGTVDWTLASNPVGIGWHRGDCTQNPNCELISENATTSKPKTVTAANAAAGTYSLIVVNLGTTNESISYRIVLTP
jgi:hypothetical protein